MEKVHAGIAGGTKSDKSTGRQKRAHSEEKKERKNDYFEKPLPSMRTTIQVLASRTSGCSKERTYSYLAGCQFQLAPRPGHPQHRETTHFEFAMQLARADETQTVPSRSHNVQRRWRWDRRSGWAVLRRLGWKSKWLRWLLVQVELSRLKITWSFPGSDFAWLHGRATQEKRTKVSELALGYQLGPTSMDARHQHSCMREATLAIYSTEN